MQYLAQRIHESLSALKIAHGVHVIDFSIMIHPVLSSPTEKIPRH